MKTPNARTPGLVLTAVLVVLSGCQAVTDREAGHIAAPSVTGAAEPVPASATLTATWVPTSTPPSTPVVTRAEATPTGVEENREPVKITVVYDNNPYDPRLKTAWGFACLIQMGDTTLLFDTGGDGSILLSNLATLEIEPTSIEIVVLSHFHADHTGGITRLLATGARPTVYVPRSFPANFKSEVETKTELVEVHHAVQIADGVTTTGEMGSGIIEQALVLDTSQGLVVVTGCAHPGVADMVRQAREIGEGEVHLVLGGFHLGNASQAQIENIIADFQALGVQKVAPCHCTGDRAMGLFREAYADRFIPNGVGQTIEIAP